MRVTVLVIDSFGIGALPDAAQYGDVGANTALHLCEGITGEKWPVLKSLGLGNAAELLGFSLPGCSAERQPQGFYGVMAEQSPGKDTTTGHWEMAGLPLARPFNYFPPEYPSFPEKLIEDFLQSTGCKGILGNKSASGTEIIKELGEDHLKTGYPIVYTSADSVMQIACHKSIFSINKLYELCKIARELCDPLNVGRVIARPFDGDPGEFFRTSERHDFSMTLPGRTIMDFLQDNKIKTTAVGKIGSIFNEQGISESWHDTGNPACLERTSALLKQYTSENEFIFVNLVDTDMLYGHRRDVQGYFDAVSEIDTFIGEHFYHLNEGDCLYITGDHGCDPTFRGTDHTREYVPLLKFCKGSPVGESLGIRASFSDMASMIAGDFGLVFPAI